MVDETSVDFRFISAERCLGLGGWLLTGTVIEDGMMLP